MVVGRFVPRYPYTNGIIKSIYKTKDDIKVEVSSLDPFHPSTIYETAIFEDNESYFQSHALESYITLTFKKYIFISHFALRPKIVDNKHWRPPRNVSLTSCLDRMCTINHKEDSSGKYENTKMILTPVIPSVSNVFNFTISGVGRGEEGAKFHTIGRLEIFGFSCDTKEECNGKLLNIINTCKTKQSLHTSIYFIIILNTSF